MIAPETERGSAAVILAAGKGVRMKSDRAKVLHPLCGMSMLEHVLRAVTRCGVDKTVVVVGHQADEIKAAFSGRGIEFRLQTQQNGTGHAIMQVESELNDYQGDVMVLPGDTPLLKPATLDRLLETHRRAGAAATLLTSRLPDPAGYGRIIRNNDGTVAKIVEEKDASASEAAVDEINVGVYCFTSSFLFPALKTIKDDNTQGELYLTDVIGTASAQAAKVVSIETGREEVLGVNNRVELARAEKIMREEINRRWMFGGITMTDPCATYIDSKVTMGKDTVIHPGCHLSGDTDIGEQCTIMPGAIIRNSRIGKGACVGAYAILEHVCLPDGGEVAPFEIRKEDYHS